MSQLFAIRIEGFPISKEHTYIAVRPADLGSMSGRYLELHEVNNPDAALWLPETLVVRLLGHVCEQLGWYSGKPVDRDLRPWRLGQDNNLEPEAP